MNPEMAKSVRFPKAVIPTLVSLLFISVFASASGIALSMTLLTLIGVFFFRSELKEIPRLPVFWPLVIFCALIAVSFLANDYWNAKAFFKMKYFLFYFILALCFVRFPEIGRMLRRIAVPLGFFVAVVGVFQFLGIFDLSRALHVFNYPCAVVPESNGHYFHARGLLYHHNPFGYGCVLLFHLLFGEALTTEDKKWRVLCWLSSVACIVAILSSCSRGAWLALLVSSTIVIVTFGRSQWRTLLKLGLVAAVIAACLGGPLTKRFRDIEPEHNTERLALWRISFEMFEDHPLFGTGFHAGFERNREAYMTASEKDNPKFPTDPHSLYFDLLGTTGIFGTLAFLLFALAVIRSYYSAFGDKSLSLAERGELLSATGAFFAFLVGAAFDSHHFHSQTLSGTILFLSMGQAIVFRHARERITARIARLGIPTVALSEG